MVDPGADVWSWAKWVLIVFAAGFIGYFGRYLSMLILERIHKKEKKEIDEEVDRYLKEKQQPQPTNEASSEAAEKYKYKLEKKRLKAEKKRLKEEEKN